MHKSTLFEILRTFLKEEISEFDDFVNSPFHNKKTNVLKLYRVIKKFAPEFKDALLKKEDVWKKIYPGKIYNYGIMKNLIYDLNKLLFRFLELKNYSLKRFESDLNLLEQYKQRSLKTLFIKKLQEAKKKIADSEIDNSSFYHSFLLDDAEMSFMDYDYLQKTKKDDYYSELNKNLTIFYFSNMLYLNSSNIQNSYAMNANLDTDFHLKIAEHYENSAFKNFYSDIMYLAYKTVLETGNEENYYRFKKIFLEKRSKLTKNMQYNLAVVLLNFCKEYNDNKSVKFSKEEFIYIKLMIEEKLYRYTGFGWLDQYLYIASMISAWRAGEYEWAENFIHEYKDELLEELREKYFNYANVNLHLRKRKFEEALKYLSKCDNSDSRDKISIRGFEFNIYYELGYYEELKSLADSTNHFLKNDKIFSEDDKESFKNYVSVLSKLMDYRFDIGNKQKESNFLQSLSNFVSKNRITNKQWVLGKIDDLIKAKHSIVPAIVI